MIRKIMAILAILLMLCTAAAAAQAETVTLAFGYEFELPEGVTIENEKWTPENLDLIYVLTGTYHHGEDKFRLRINKWNLQIKKGNEYTELIEIIGGEYGFYLEITSDIREMTKIKGRTISSEKKVEEIEDTLCEIIDYVVPYLYVMKEETEENIPTYLYTSASGVEIRLPEDTEITEEEWTPEHDQAVYRFGGRYDNGKGAFAAVIYYRDNYADNMDYAMGSVGRKIDGVKMPLCVEHDINPWGICVETKEGMTMESIMNSFDSAYAFLEEFDAAVQGNARDFAHASQDEESNNGNLIAVSDFFGEYTKYRVNFEEKFFDALPAPVAEGRYMVKVGKSSEETALIESYEGEVCISTYAYHNEYGVELRDVVYEYMPLPESFIGVENLPDEEYIIKIDEAVELLGEKKAELLRELLVKEFGATKPELITHENLKLEYSGLIEELEKLRQGLNWISNDYMGRLEKIDLAIGICRFWERYQEQEKLDRAYRDFLVNGKRWMEMKYRLTSSWGGYGNCAVFDGALHYVEGNVDLTSLERVENWQPKQEPAGEQVSEMEKGEETGEPLVSQGNVDEQKQEQTIKTHRTAIVNTKSDPLSMRKTPSQKGNVILTIKKGETVTVLEEGDWPLVEYNGRQGYVNGKYLK